MYSVAVQSIANGAISSRPQQDAGANWSASDDNARFASVVMPHIDAAYSLAHWLTGNRSDAEDVVQDASLRAFRAVRGFAGGSARAWVLSIVRNTAYAWLHKNRPAAVITVEDLEAVEAAHAKPRPTPNNCARQSRRCRRRSARRWCCATSRVLITARSQR
jgi:RNA polymerase sigma factor (sigma-70 family)